MLQLDTLICITHTWSNHDLMFVSPDSKERQVVGWIEVSHSATGLCCQLLNLAGILNSCGIIQCATNWNTFMWRGMKSM